MREAAAHIGKSVSFFRDRSVFVPCSSLLILIVVAVFWAKVLCHLVVEEARFRMRVSLGVILIRSLVNPKDVSGRLWSGSGVALN